MTKPFSVGSIHTLPRMEDSVRVDDLEGVDDRSDTLE